MNLAIMQPCYLPWRGYFALMSRADVFVHLDDVALPQGRSLQTRVAIKSATGRQWLSLPIAREPNVAICNARLADDRWRHKHAATLHHAYGPAAEVVLDVYDRPWEKLCDLNLALIDRLATALDICPPIHRSSSLSITATGSDRILALCKKLGATRYLTGHGSRNYLDHDRFEDAGIEVLYLDYDLSPYNQPHGPFDPFVTVLDVLTFANKPKRHITAQLVPWREFTARPANIEHEITEEIAS